MYLTASRVPYWYNIKACSAARPYHPNSCIHMVIWYAEFEFRVRLDRPIVILANDIPKDNPKKPVSNETQTQQQYMKLIKRAPC